MWVFGDLKRPLLGPSSRTQLLASLGEKSAEINGIIERHFKSIKRKSTVPELRAERENSLSSLISILETVRNQSPDVINLKGFSFENEYYSESVLISELPWSPESWSTLLACGLEKDSKAIQIDGISWGELLENGNWLVIFEIMHNQHDWAPFAFAENLLIPQNSDLFSFAIFLEDMLTARAQMAIFQKPGWSTFIRRKFGWGCPPVSLTQLGIENDVTRERARQVELEFCSHFSAVNLEAAPALIDLEDLVDMALKSELDDDALIEDSSLQAWGEESIASLIGLYMGENSRAEFMCLLESKRAIASEKLKKAKRLSKYRSKLGTFRISQLEPFLEETGIARSDLEEAIVSAYPKAVFAGDYVVATAKSREPLIFNALTRQLSIHQPLHFEVLLKGLEQTATFRNATLDLPSPTTFKEILSKSSSFEIDSSGFVSQVGEGFTGEIDSIRGWIVEYLKNEPGQVAHKATLLRDAARAGYKFTSVSLYLSYSPEFRLMLAGKSIHSLVGAKPSALELSNAKELALINRVAGSESKVYVEDNGDVIANFVFGTDFMVSGVISVSPSLGQLLGTEPRSVECCHLLVSESKPKMSSKTFLSNMAAVRDHLWFDHGMQEGSRFKLIAGKDNLVVVPS